MVKVHEKAKFEQVGELHPPSDMRFSGEDRHHLASFADKIYSL